MKPNKKKWIKVIRQIMHTDPIIVASTYPDFDMLGTSEYRLAKIGKQYLLGRFDSAADCDYEWYDSAEKVKEDMIGLLELIKGEDDWSGWQDPELVDSIEDSASLFGEEWEPDDIVREIEADENFRIRIINEDEEIPDEYED